MSLLAWATIALVLGLALVALEVFIPSGGILGFLAFSSLTTAIVLAFMHDSLVGAGFLTVVILALPTIIIIGLHWFPHTPVGKKVLLAAPTSKDVLPSAESLGGLSNLVGQAGRAKTKMLPSGAVQIGDRAVDAVTEGVAIDPGQLVRVVEVRGARVVVRPIDESELVAQQPKEVDLSQPIESLGLTQFDDPLA